MQGTILDRNTKYYSKYLSSGAHTLGCATCTDSLKELATWVSQAESSVEKDSRSLVQDIFGYILTHDKGDELLNEFPRMQKFCEYIYVDGVGYGYSIKLHDRELKSFPKMLPENKLLIHSLDLSNNYLDELPGDDYHFVPKVVRLNMSGNKRLERLDSIKISVQFLDVSNCNVQELTTNFFLELRSMALCYKEVNLESLCKEKLLCEIDITGNPLSSSSIEQIKDFVKAGFGDVVVIIYDDGDKLGIRTSDAAEALKEEYRIKEDVITRKLESLKGILPAIARQNDLGYYANYFSIVNSENIPKHCHNLVVVFLAECLPLSRFDPSFSRYVRNTLNSTLSNENFANYFFSAIDSEDRLTFNKIKECWLVWNMRNGKYNNDPEVLKSSLRNLFLSQEIEKHSSGSASDLAQYEMLLKDKLKLDVPAKCQKLFKSPPKNDLQKMVSLISNAKKSKLEGFVNNHPIWKEFWHNHKVYIQ